MKAFSSSHRINQKQKQCIVNKLILPSDNMTEVTSKTINTHAEFNTTVLYINESVAHIWDRKGLRKVFKVSEKSVLNDAF